MDKTQTAKPTIAISQKAHKAVKKYAKDKGMKLYVVVEMALLAYVSQDNHAASPRP